MSIPNHKGTNLGDHLFSYFQAHNIDARDVELINFCGLEGIFEYDGKDSFCDMPKNSPYLMKWGANLRVIFETTNGIGINSGMFLYQNNPMLDSMYMRFDIKGRYTSVVWQKLCGGIGQWRLVPRIKEGEETTLWETLLWTLEKFSLTEDDIMSVETPEKELCSSEFKGKTMSVKGTVWHDRYDTLFEYNDDSQKMLYCAVYTGRYIFFLTRHGNWAEVEKPMGYRFLVYNNR